MSQINRKEKEEKKCFVFALKRALLMLTDREKTRPSEDNCGEKKNKQNKCGRNGGTNVPTFLM